jgi:hypothetical protein
LFFGGAVPGLAWPRPKSAPFTRRHGLSKLAPPKNKKKTLVAADVYKQATPTAFKPSTDVESSLWTFNDV